MRDRLKDMPPHFRTVWRPSHTKSLSNLGKNKLRAATQYLTGHCELNYHLNKYRPQNISKICPHCSMEEETMNHFIGQCPMWFNRRERFFNCYYTSISEVADRIPLKNIVGYICSTNRFNQQWLVKARKRSMQRLRNCTKYMNGESTRPLRPYLTAASLIRRIPLRRRNRLSVRKSFTSTHDWKSCKLIRFQPPSHTLSLDFTQNTPICRLCDPTGYWAASALLRRNFIVAPDQVVTLLYGYI